MGQSQSSSIKINYEDMQHILKRPDHYLIINTLSSEEQQCLITHTLNATHEETTINDCMKKGLKSVNIVLYGKNSNDDKLRTKYNQLTSLGFYNVYVYTGGMFEWLLLQDIFGENEFPTTQKEMDILKFKSPKLLRTGLLENNMRC